MNKNYIFDNKNGKLEFIGDFEGLYKNNEDPWSQSGSDSLLQKHYNISRNKLLKKISNLRNKNICEIGSGLGYVTNFLSKGLKDSTVDGVDISSTAVKKASSKFANLNFFTADICSINFSLQKRYDIVILNQILWYILRDLENVFYNIDKLLDKDGYLVISTLFLKEQKYGNEIIGSFDDLINYCYKNYKDSYRVIVAEIDYLDSSSDYRDSILILQKIN